MLDLRPIDVLCRRSLGSGTPSANARRTARGVHPTSTAISAALTPFSTRRRSHSAFRSVGSSCTRRGYEIARWEAGLAGAVQAGSSVVVSPRCVGVAVIAKHPPAHRGVQRRPAVNAEPGDARLRGRSRRSCTGPHVAGLEVEDAARASAATTTRRLGRPTPASDVVDSPRPARSYIGWGGRSALRRRAREECHEQRGSPLPRSLGWWHRSGIMCYLRRQHRSVCLARSLPHTRGSETWRIGDRGSREIEVADCDTADEFIAMLDPTSDEWTWSPRAVRHAWIFRGHHYSSWELIQKPGGNRHRQP